MDEILYDPVDDLFTIMTECLIIEYQLVVSYFFSNSFPQVSFDLAFHYITYESPAPWN